MQTNLGINPCFITPCHSSEVCVEVNRHWLGCVFEEAVFILVFKKCTPPPTPPTHTTTSLISCLSQTTPPPPPTRHLSDEATRVQTRLTDHISRRRRWLMMAREVKAVITRQLARLRSHCRTLFSARVRRGHPFIRQTVIWREGKNTRKRREHLLLACFRLSPHPGGNSPWCHRMEWKYMHFIDPKLGNCAWFQI